MIPVIPLFALELGGSLAMAGAIVALRGLGMLAFDLPAGVLVRRVGEPGAMVIGTGALAAVAIGASLSPSLLVLAPLVFIMGCAWSIWLLARLSYATEVAPLEMRGRVLSLLGGSNRMGTFVGPFVGGFVAEYAGLESAFYLQAALAATAAALMFLVVPADEGRDVALAAASDHRMGLVLRENRGVFATAGVVALAIAALRSARQAVIPLWGSAIGLDAGAIGVIFGLATIAEMVMFYPAGLVMDHYGRKWTAVPCLLTLSAGVMAIPLTTTFTGLLLAALVTGVGNGMGAGIVMTLGADYAPPSSRAEFLGVWRFFTDIGTAGGPTMLSVITAVSTLGIATVMTGATGVAGAFIMYRFVREPLSRTTGTSRPS